MKEKGKSMIAKDNKPTKNLKKINNLKLRILLTYLDEIRKPVLKEIKENDPIAQAVGAKDNDPEKDPNKDDRETKIETVEETVVIETVVQDQETGRKESIIATVNKET